MLSGPEFLVRAIDSPSQVENVSTCTIFNSTKLVPCLCTYGHFHSQQNTWIQWLAKCEETFRRGKRHQTVIRVCDETGLVWEIEIGPVARNSDNQVEVSRCLHQVSSTQLFFICCHPFPQDPTELASTTNYIAINPEWSTVRTPATSRPYFTMPSSLTQSENKCLESARLGTYSLAPFPTFPFSIIS